MNYPAVVIDKNKLFHNTKELVNMCSKKGIKVAGVTKVFCAIPELAQVMVDGGVDILADSRINNLIKLKNINIKKMLIRIPMLSEVEQLIEYVDISLNSEIETIKKISQAALKKGKKHEIILMVDLGDLREGVWFLNAVSFVEEIIKLKGIYLKGIGVNMNCYGGVIPSKKTMEQLLEISKTMEKTYDIKIDVISGGTSGGLHLIMKDELPQGINQYRLGESIVGGIERGYDQRIENTFDDVFIFKAELVELKEKPSVPIGVIGFDSFGQKPKFTDKGIIKRGILACGRQDVKIEGLNPLDGEIEILGGSSDHMIINLTDCSNEYKVGDVLSFKMDYAAMLMTFTSEYVKKKIVNNKVEMKN